MGTRGLGKVLRAVGTGTVKGTRTRGVECGIRDRD